MKQLRWSRRNWNLSWPRSGLQSQVSQKSAGGFPTRRTGEQHRQLSSPGSIVGEVGRARDGVRIAGGLLDAQCQCAGATDDPVPAMDEGTLWNRVASLDLKPVVTQLVNYLCWSETRAASMNRTKRRSARRGCSAGLTHRSLMGRYRSSFENGTY